MLKGSGPLHDTSKGWSPLEDMQSVKQVGMILYHSIVPRSWVQVGSLQIFLKVLGPLTGCLVPHVTWTRDLEWLYILDLFGS